ncbi:MAG: Stp1/IreP family PP2C-type Ser/Thr phosphatase [Myxococcales bacterium]|nr:Stp1/IreP family PP2C-type Ser/Thr phosphatase [Myxococcales bacterium]
MGERFQVEHAARTDVGRKRSHNEDAFNVVTEDQLFMVADGMGGHNAGEVASAMAVELVSQFFGDARRDPPVLWPYKVSHDESHDAETLAIAVQYANLRIFESARENSDRRGMGTTFVGALIRHNAAYVAHVGDSRGYVVRASGPIEPLTIDHSLLEEYRRTRPDLTEEQLKKFPYKNVVTRALGMKSDVCVELHRHELHAGDTVVLCCDGLTGMITDEHIGRIVRDTPDLNACSKALIDAANANGGLDNITVVLARLK